MDLELRLKFNSLDEMAKVVNKLNEVTAIDKRAFITFEELKKCVADATSMVGRDTVQTTVAKYAPVLSQVNELDFENLYTDILKLKGIEI